MVPVESGAATASVGNCDGKGMWVREWMGMRLYRNVQRNSPPFGDEKQGYYQGSIQGALRDNNDNNNNNNNNNSNNITILIIMLML